MPAKKQIDYSSSIFFIGSCFSNNIGDKLFTAKLNTLINPFGIVFNSASIAEQIDIIVNKKTFTAQDFFSHNNVFKSFVLHSSLSKKIASELQDSVNKKINETHDFLNSSTHIFITLGSAFAYKHIATNKIVSNCHKLPQVEFEKILLNYTEVFESLKSISKNILKINSKAKIPFVFLLMK